MNKCTSMLILLLLLITPRLFGCASIYSRTGKTEPQWVATGKIYPGLQADIALTGVMIVGFDSKLVPFFFLMLPFVIADIPLSFVIDTVCLPYDIFQIDHTVEQLWYGASTYWVIKRNGQGQLHGKMTFQLDTDSGTIWGATRYKNGLAHGIATAHGEPWGDEEIKGEYVNGKFWNGSFLVYTGSPNNPTVGPVVYYKEGVLAGTSKRVFHILKRIL